jgi:hypothetical protein
VIKRSEVKERSAQPEVLKDFLVEFNLPVPRRYGEG